MKCYSERLNTFLLFIQSCFSVYKILLRACTLYFRSLVNYTPKMSKKRLTLHTMGTCSKLQKFLEKNKLWIPITVSYGFFFLRQETVIS